MHASNCDEVMTHWYGSQERKERRKTMGRRNKVRVSVMIICAVLLSTSMVVFASTWLTKSTSVELDSTGYGNATTEIRSYGSSARASTSGHSLTKDPLSTHIIGGGADPVEDISGTSVQIYAQESPFTYATSTHRWTNRHYTQTIYR